MTRFTLSATAAAYLNLRCALLDPANRQVSVPHDRADFWQWYADLLRGPGEVEAVADGLAAPPFAEPSGRIALWHSGGVAATYSLLQLRHLEPVVLRYEDFQASIEPPQAGGQLEFVLAILSADLGFSVAYLGIVVDHLRSRQLRHVGAATEGSPEFLEAWNSAHPRHRLRSACAHLSKEEVLSTLLADGVGGFSSCEVQPDGWCRDCDGCVLAYYRAKALGASLGFRITAQGYQRVQDAYERYVRGGFRDNPAGVLQHYLRLQVCYGVEFDRFGDCA